jgi:hypothetical protein
VNSAIPSCDATALAKVFVLAELSLRIDKLRCIVASLLMYSGSFEKVASAWSIFALVAAIACVTCCKSESVISCEERNETR